MNPLEQTKFLESVHSKAPVEENFHILFKDCSIRGINFVDLYKLTLTHIKSLERMAEKSSDKLIRSISGSKNTAFDKFIYSLGIKEVGITTAESLAKNYTNVEDLMSANQAELCSINDIGEIVAENIYN